MSKITVIIINHGDEATLPRALASLVLQAVHIDIVLVADGPGQRLEETVARFPELSIRHIENEKNLGRGASRRRALELAMGDWVAFLDADDWYLSDKLALQLATARADRSLGLISSDVLLCTEQPRAAAVRRFGGPRGILTRHEVPFAASLIRTPIAKRAGFDSSYKVGEDRGFLERVLREAPAYVMPVPLYAYQQSSQRSLADEFDLRRAHLRQEFAAGQAGIGLGITVIREFSAALASQLSQRTGHWLGRFRRVDVPAQSRELASVRETASRIQVELLRRGFSGESVQLVFD